MIYVILSMMDYRVFDSLLDSVFVIDLENKVNYCNQAAADLCGLSKKRVEGKLKLSDILEVDSIWIFEKVGAELEKDPSKPAVSPYEEVNYKALKTNTRGKAQISVQAFPLETSIELIIFLRDTSVEVKLQEKYAELKNGQPGEGDGAPVTEPATLEGDPAPAAEPAPLAEPAPSEAPAPAAKPVVNEAPAPAAEAPSAQSESPEPDTVGSAPFKESVTVIFNGNFRVVAKGGRISIDWVEFIMKGAPIPHDSSAAIEFMGSTNMGAFDAIGQVSNIWERTADLMPGEIYVKVTFPKLRASSKKSIEDYIKINGFKI